MAEQACRKHARVVDDEQIAGTEQFWQRRHRRVSDWTAAAGQIEETSRPALGGRLLGDQFRRKLEVELADVHPRSMVLNERSAARRPPGCAATRRRRSSTTLDRGIRRCEATSAAA